MVLKILGAIVSTRLFSEYLLHVIAAITAIFVANAFAQGRRTTRERDLHARVILITGGFTPFGMTLIQSLAERGAHIIALSPHPIDSPEVEIMITLVRSTTKNEQIFAEECDLSSPASVRSFCARFLTGEDKRLDALVFAHEYQHIGAMFGKRQSEDEKERRLACLATFLLITLLLPSLLVAPVERDIRIISVVNPFYAAAAASFSPSLSTTPPQSSVFLREGQRSLRMAVLLRHLQRVLDALPSAQVPKATESSSTVPVVNEKSQRSNIVAVSVSPGISRSSTMAPLLHAGPTDRSRLGLVLYIILQPMLRILTKSATSALQSVLHVLFLPTPFKLLSQKATSSASTGARQKTSNDKDVVSEELLKPGALYSECAVVDVKFVTPVPQDTANGKGKGVAEPGDSEHQREVGAEIPLPDDGELGGELNGRLVWESFEEALKLWELENPQQESYGNAKRDEPPKTS